MMHRLRCGKGSARILFATAVLFIACPAFAAPDLEGCDTPSQLQAHATAVKKMLEDVRRGSIKEFNALVPQHTRDLHDVDVDAFKDLLATSNYAIFPRETKPPYFCASVVTKWTRHNESEEFWMVTFTFRDGVLAEVNRDDLFLMGKYLPPPAPPAPRN